MMNQDSFFTLHSWQCHGMERQPVTIEALRSQGLSQLTLTGLPSAWLRDSRDKIRAVVARHAAWGPLDRVLIHLLPADESKSGAHLEFPIVVACMLALLRETPPPEVLRFLSRHRLVGSVSLAGDLCATEMSRLLESGDPERTIGPSRFASVKEFWDFLVRGEFSLPKSIAEEAPKESETDTGLPVRERWWQRFWLLVAAIAEQPVLLSGPPGAGKSHLARWAHALLPEPDEVLSGEIRNLWNIAGRASAHRIPLVRPHARANVHEFLGQMRMGSARPGFFSLAHGGLLILDEFAELNRDCREILRTVLERKEIESQLGGRSVRWPANFWLIATVNPCPCGYARVESHADCRCHNGVRQQYQARLSGPLLDRMGMKLFVGDEGMPNGRIVAPDLFDRSRLDGPPRDLRRLVKETRSRMTLAHADGRRALLTKFDTRAHSERCIGNKVKLLAALQALTGQPLPRLVELLAVLTDLEDKVFPRSLPAPRPGSIFRPRRESHEVV